MRAKSCKYLTSLLLLSLVLCACGRNVSDPDNDMVTEDSGYVPAQVIGPETEPTFENRLAIAQQAYENMCYFYSEMQELEQSEEASEEGKEAAAALKKEYADRIAELAETDFSQLTSEELLSVSTECLDIISAIREVKDALN